MNHSRNGAFSSPFPFILIILAVATMAWLGSLLLTPAAASGPLPTATPTKTPPPPAKNEAPAAQPLAVMLPTFTPAPTPIPPTPPTATPTPLPQPTNPPSDWIIALAHEYGINPQGRYIVVDQDNQQMHIVDNGELVRLLDITTGDPALGWDTPAWFGVVGEYWGTFQGLGGVKADEGWWLFKRGGNFLIHGLPYVLDDKGQKVYKGADDLGAAPASRGCIRLAPDDARWFSAWQPQGVPIIILPYTDPAEIPG